jgi:hypothetical protein
MSLINNKGIVACGYGVYNLIACHFMPFVTSIFLATEKLPCEGILY